jgi:Icc-related predicted phosphoesterase
MPKILYVFRNFKNPLYFIKISIFRGANIIKDSMFQSVMNRLTKWIVGTVLTGLAFGGCSSGNIPEKVTLNNSTYKIAENKITQTKSSFMADGAIKIGVGSDIQGNRDMAEKSAEEFKKKNVDAIVLAGDIYENESMMRSPKYPSSTDNVQEMYDCLEPYVKLGIPVFVIPGNHEVQSVYEKAIKNLKKEYPNIFDIHGSSVDLEGLNMVASGGYHDTSFLAFRGYRLKKSDYDSIEDQIKNFQASQKEEPVLLVTHGPPKSGTRIDYVQGAGHVGDTNLADILNSSELEKLIIHIFGHIIEGGGYGDGSYKNGTAVNIAGIDNPFGDGSYSVITLKDGNMLLERYYLP